MVHVWSINSGERFQGHHGPLVKRLVSQRHQEVFLNGNVLTLSQTAKLGRVVLTSKLKKFADDNFKFDENGRKLSKWVENTVGKGEIACYKQFILFPQCFQKTCIPKM